ncbi:MAG: hypothetical protein JWM85_3030 [Acidimicrobiaceae bacterium]|nr:hypothetical protein [Acidimicrobiaceae bacterium]
MATSPSAPRPPRRRLPLILVALIVIVGAAIGVVLGRSRPAAAITSPLTVADHLHGGRFLVKATGATFVIRGFDYQPVIQTGNNRFVNESFAPSYYRHAKVASAAKAWEAAGYDTVRVFLNPAQIGNPSGGLDHAYVANLADFVMTAAHHDVRTLVTVGVLPTAGGFLPATRPQFGLVNEDYLDPRFIAAEQRYLAMLISNLRNDQAPLVDVMWELKGEQEWANRTAPLSWTSGTVTTANGRSYDMASLTSRNAMEDDGLAYWANHLTSTIERDAPNSLVGVGAYPLNVNHKQFTVRVDALFGSATKLSFVDIHTYPNLGPELAQIESFHGSDTSKPVIMGEFGAVRAQSLEAAKASLVSWQKLSCHLGGLSVSGWLMWTWNSGGVQKEFWDAIAGGGVLSRALAPVTRPNPCS